MINYIFVNNRNRSSVKDVKVISGEKIVRKHCLLLIDIVFKKEAWGKIRFRKKLKLWRLRVTQTKEEIAEGVNNKCDGNEDWCGLKGKLLDDAIKVCDYTKSKLGHFEIWWWNKDVGCKDIGLGWLLGGSCDQC